MKSQIGDLSIVKPYIYWCDFIISSIFSWGFFLLAYFVSFKDPIYYVFVILSGIGFYRAVAFTHELVHVKKDTLKGFRLVWHIFCGLPLLAPHFLYKNIHIAHHSRKDYGKDSDGEYLEFGTESRWLILLHFLYNLIIPIFSIFRFMILSILSLSHPKLRLFVMKKMSFMGLRFSFIRNIPSQKSEIVIWYLEEFSCCFFTWLVFIFIHFQLLSINIIFQWYAILIIVLTMNSLRTLGATHWYTSVGGNINFIDQIRDSVSITSNSILTHVFCPVGTQYHSLHHMFPFIPYHSLGAVYRYLIENFSEERILKETSCPSLFVSWKKAWLLPRTEKMVANQNVI